MANPIGWLFVLVAWILIMIGMMLLFLGPVMQIIHIVFANIGIAKPNRKIFNTFNILGFCISAVSYTCDLVIAILSCYGSIINEFANCTQTDTIIALFIIASVLFIINTALFILCLIKRSKYKKKCLNN